MGTIEQVTSSKPPPVTVSLQQIILRYGVFISLGILLLFALVRTPELYSPQTIFLILRQASQLGLVAIGQTLVLLASGLDLSVGGIIVLTSIVIAQVGANQDRLIIPSVLLALVLGALVGLGNGLLITKRNVPPFVATLGMLVLVQGALLAFTKGIPSGQVPPGMNVINQGIGPFPISFLIWVGFTIIIGVVLQMTPFGRRLYAVGANRKAAHLSGINVDRTVIAVFVACSLMSVVAGVVLSSYVGYVDRYLGRGLDLDSIAAAVVGGTAFVGGRGNLWGTMAGVLIVQLLTTISVQLGLDVQLQLAIKGLAIIGAVALYSVAARSK